MLATLLPGIREIRTPLAVGYAWLITLWLAVGYRAPQPSEAHGFLADIYRLSHVAGPAAVGVVVSVGAYLFGVIATSIGLAVTYKAGEVLRKTPLGPVTPGTRREDSVRRAVDHSVAMRLARRMAEDESLRMKALDHTKFDGEVSRSDVESELVEEFWLRYALVNESVDRWAMTENLQIEISDIAARLRGIGDPAALEYDRLQAEADFRLAMFGPLAALCIVAGFRWSPLVMLIMPLLTALLYIGVSARTEAETGIAYALASGRVTDPAVERLTTATIRFKDNEKHLPSTASTSEAEATGSP